MRNCVVWGQLGIDAQPDRRREHRRTIDVPIEVTGFASDGKFFAERTVTVDVSESGCSFRLRRVVERGGIVAIKLIAESEPHSSANDPFLYQVVYATNQGREWAIGTAKLQEQSLWAAIAAEAKNTPQ